MMATGSDHSSISSAVNQSTTATIVSASLNSTADHSGTGKATQFDMVTTVTVDHTTNRITNNASSVTGMTMDTFKDTTHYPNEHLRTMSVDAATTTILLANATQNDDDIVPYSPHLNTENSTTNQKSSSSPLSSLNDLLTVTLHLSSASTVVTEPDINTATINSSSMLQQPQRTDLVRVILIPISGLEQRESEMIQTARALQIPSTRWNGSLLYNLYHQQRQQMVAVEGGNDTIGERISSSSSGRITLHLYQDSDLKWSITNNSHTEQILDWNTPDTSTTAATTVGLSSSLPPSSSSSIWFGTSLNKNIDVDWIQAYYVTGRISIPSNARGYDVLWLLEYFQLMYQPDQFHFANYATYTRVQLWSKYYCYLRPKLIDWILQEINQQQKQQRSQSDDHQDSMFPLLFGTMSSNETSIELGTDRLLPLGDITEPISTIKSNVSNGSSKRTLADRALKLFNTSYIETTRNHATGHQQQHKHYSGTKSCTDEAQSQTTVPCPEELTATEIRNDFCRFLKHRLCENSSADNTNVTWNVQFTVRPVTLHYNVENEIIPEDTMNSNSSNSSTPLTNGSVVHSDSAGTNNTNKHIKNVVHQRYLVAHRAVLVIDAHPQQEVNESKQQRLPSIKVSRSKSDLSAPVDELVEEEIAKGRLEELLQQVEARGEQVTDKQDRRVTINETLSFEKEKSVRSNDESKSFDTPILATAMSNQKSFDMLDLNAPDDELNASLDNGNSSFNASIGIFPISTMKKKKKPKPVFVLPDKLLDVDNTESPPLARMKLPIVKSSPIVGSKPNDALALPGPITIVRKGTFDNTVTSALTGPFYIDENGVLRDVFDNCDPDSDEDFEGDEDTRAQARRHEWIQTALLNRGIGERMETLLKEDREPNTNATTTSFDPWDWISGLNVCELSREVMKSVEQYASCVLCESSGVVKQSSTTNEGAATTNMSATIFPLLSKEKVTANPVILKHEETMRSSETEPLRDNIRPHMKSLQDDQSREDEHFEHIVENIVFTTDLDSREGSFGSHGTKESPRGVQRFDSASSADKVSTEPIGSEQTDARTSLLGKADVAAPKPINEKKIRGIKSLFRRKRVDSTGI